MNEALGFCTEYFSKHYHSFQRILDANKEVHDYREFLMCIQENQHVNLGSVHKYVLFHSIHTIQLIKCIIQSLIYKQSLLQPMAYRKYLQLWLIQWAKCEVYYFGCLGRHLACTHIIILHVKSSLHVDELVVSRLISILKINLCKFVLIFVFAMHFSGHACFVFTMHFIVGWWVYVN